MEGSNVLLFKTSKDSKLEEYFSMPLEEQRYYHYQRKITGLYKFTETSLIKKNNNIYFGHANKRVGFNDKSGFYVKMGSKIGFTLDGDKRKLNIWFNDGVVSFIPYFSDIFNALNLTWITNNSYLYGIIRKTSFKKILLGEITNPQDLIVFYMRYSLKFKKSEKISHKLFNQLLHITLNGNSGLHFDSLASYFKVSTDVNNCMKKLIELTDHTNKDDITKRNIRGNVTILSDTVRQACSLGEKINFNWSDKRIKQLHASFSKKLMMYEYNLLEKTHINYSRKLNDIPFGGKLINKQEDLFLEGSEMIHCVYTNYWEEVKAKKYFVISVNTDLLRFTVGIRKRNDFFNSTGDNKTEFIVDQIYGIANENVDSVYKDVFKNWLKNSDVQKFFIENSFPIKWNIEKVALPDLQVVEPF